MSCEKRAVLTLLLTDAYHHHYHVDVLHCSTTLPTNSRLVMSRYNDDRTSSLLTGPASSYDSDYHSSETNSSTLRSWLSSHRRLVASLVITAVALLLVLIVAVYFVGRSHGESPASSSVVQLPQGAIEGTVSSSCSTYYSIPFAQPPVGSLRWLPPVTPAPSWTGVRDGSTPPPRCVQPSRASASGVVGDEDCLYLNVYGNEAWKDRGPLPVLVFIHGGSSITGYSALDINAHCDLVHSRPIVAVTINYRLNVFGYLALDVLSQRQANETAGSGVIKPTSGNYGLRDNIAALQWIRDNIAHFGGDPGRVTIYGQSTGGTNVMALYVSPLAVGLFHSALSLSSSPVLKGTLAEAEAQNFEFIANSNCSLPSSSATSACLLALTPSQVWSAVPSRWLGSYDLGIQNRSWPDAVVIAVDGEVVTDELNAALRAGVGSSSNVTLAFGHMGQEVDIGPMANVTGYSQAQWEQWLSGTLPALGWNDTVVRALQAAYPISDYENESQLAYEMIVNDIIYCGGINNLRALSSRSSPPSPPIYHHLIDYAPVVPVAYLGTRSWLTRYAGHEWDQLLLLRTWPQGYQADAMKWGGAHGDELRAETLRRMWVDDLVIGGGNRAGGGLWTEFDREWTSGQESDMYTARFGRSGEVDVLANHRWDKCTLLDSLGFADAGWAN